MRWHLVAALAFGLAALALPYGARAEEDFVHVSSRITYDARPDQGPVRVDWDLSFQNNDPGTSAPGSTGTVLFYHNVTVPVLRGASGVSAVSSSGTALDVVLDDEGQGPTITATISFDERVFFGESYDFHLAYQLADVRVPSLLVSSTYVYLPVIAGGDEATVTVSYPSGDGWDVSLEAGECSQDGTTFSCAGEDTGFLAAVLEVSRPDAIARMAFDVPLRTSTVKVDLRYFIGEEGSAAHLRELATAGLPIIEDQYGFGYPGSDSVTISQGGRQVVLGYEGLTTCDLNGDCSVIVSPAADDVTVLHELAHLWSEVYGERWLSEGFAQVIAEETAAALPAGLVQSRPPEREPAAVALPLDDWGSVSSLIGAKEAERQAENAGYDLSVRFLYELRSQVGTDALKRANAAIAAGGRHADSQRFLDVVEETSGQTLDGLFAEWVFPSSFKPTLDARREARARLKEVIRRTAGAGLSDEVPNAIRASVEEWQFDAALAELTEAERKLGEYDVLKRALTLLTEKAQGAGLKLPTTIAAEIGNWQFPAARLMFAEADRAVDAYIRATERVDAPRSLWERFGVIGKQPRDDLQRAGEAFAAGEFEAALVHANEARDAVDNASETGLRRLLILGLVLGLIAAGIGASVWFSRRRERELY